MRASSNNEFNGILFNSISLRSLILLLFSPPSEFFSVDPIRHSVSIYICQDELIAFVATFQRTQCVSMSDHSFAASSSGFIRLEGGADSRRKALFTNSVYCCCLSKFSNTGPFSADRNHTLAQEAQRCSSVAVIAGTSRRTKTFGRKRKNAKILRQLEQRVSSLNGQLIGDDCHFLIRRRILHSAPPVHFRRCS